MKLLIPHSFSYEKYYPGATDLPYEATGAKLRDEIRARAPEIEVILSENTAQTDKAIVDAEALVAYSVPQELINRAPKLRWIQAASAGIDHFFKSSGLTPEILSQRKIVLTKAAGVTRIVIGEHVFAMILALTRGVPRAVRQQERREWQIFTGSEISGRTLGIVGLGEIGERVAELGRAFGMHVIGTRRSTEFYAGFANRAYSQVEINKVFEAADILVLACSLNDETRGLINRESLARMKSGALLINIARGEVVVEDDLVEALRSGQIAAAALDTFGRSRAGALRDLEALRPESALWELENLLVMPNNAAGTDRVFYYLAEIIADNHRRITSGNAPRHAVPL